MSELLHKPEVLSSVKPISPTVTTAGTIEAPRETCLGIHVCELVDEFDKFSTSQDAPHMKLKQGICILFWTLLINGLLLLTGVWTDAITFVLTWLGFVGVLFGLAGLGLWTISWCCGEC